MSLPPAAKTLAPVAASGCGLLFALLFTGVIGLALYPLHAARSWRETECDIVDASSTKDIEDNDWDVVITWRFEIGNHSYQTQGGPAIFDLSYGREEADEVMERFAPGRRVVCFYDPEDPTKSTLDRSPAPWSAYAFALGTVITLLASIIGVVASLWRWRSGAARG